MDGRVRLENERMNERGWMRGLGLEIKNELASHLLI